MYNPYGYLLNDSDFDILTFRPVYVLFVFHLLMHEYYVHEFHNLLTHLWSGTFHFYYINIRLPSSASIVYA